MARIRLGSALGVCYTRVNTAVPKRLRDEFDVTMVSTTGLVPGPWQ